MQKKVNIIGAGLAGSEACYFLLKRGYEVHLYEKRPKIMTPAHVSPYFAELVCSNSLKSNNLDNACGLLKEEIRHMDSLLMKVANETFVPSGNALSVDREKFAKRVTEILISFPNLIIHNEDVNEPPEGPTIICTGPLTSDGLSKYLTSLTNEKSLFFFDASAPIIKLDSVNMEKAYFKSRYDQGDNSYLNCPFSKEEYDKFYNELINAELAFTHSFDKSYFEGCMPIEVMAKRGYDTLRFGPLKPKGLQIMSRPKAYAVLQLRQDNLHGDLYNLVGFQTNLTYKEQMRVFRLIPGLENVEFVRFGLMHRNTYLCSPILLNENLSFKNRNDLFVAGQLSGVEGYVESMAIGIISAINISRYIEQKESIDVPLKTIIGSLVHYITHADINNFSPMNANFGILFGAHKKEQRNIDIEDSLKAIDAYWREINA